MFEILSGRLLTLALTMIISVACSSSPSANVTAKYSTPISVADADHSTHMTAAGIQSLDFSNFNYPWFPALGKSLGTFRLLDGKYEGTDETAPMQIFSVVYGDLTNDSEDDAVVALDIIVKGGSAAPNVIYVYTMKDRNPRLLWAFETGDRASGGLRRVYPENGMLVVELYGKGKIIGTNLFADDGTTAMTPLPFYYTRTRYKWNGSRFRREGPAETLSDPEKYGIPIMPTYRSNR